MKKSFLKITVLSLLYSLSFNSSTFAASSAGNPSTKKFDETARFYELSQEERNQGLGLMKTTYRKDKNKESLAIFAILNARNAQTIRLQEEQMKALQVKIKNLESQLGQKQNLLHEAEGFKQENIKLHLTLEQTKELLRQEKAGKQGLQIELNDARQMAESLRENFRHTENLGKKEEDREGLIKRLQDSLHKSREEQKQQMASFLEAQEEIRKVTRELTASRAQLEKAKAVTREDQGIMKDLESERDDLAAECVKLERQLKHAQQRLEEVSPLRDRLSFSSTEDFEG